MVVRNSRDLIPVVVYYRCSSPQQELSVAEQREAVRAYAERKGYRIIREYVDEGKSASKDPHKRTAFNRMIADSGAQEFKVVVCYDAARFTRYDNIEGSTPKQILRSNGVILDTTKEGEFDWNAPEGRWKDMAYCEANRALSLNISKDSIRGRLALVALGYWPNGIVPYAYDREYVDGTSTTFKRRHERFRKPRSSHLRLVVNEPEAAIVREVFDLYVNRLWSRRQIAMELTRRRVPPPLAQHGRSEGGWQGLMVLTMLREKAYIGVATIGNGRQCRAAHNRVSPTERAGACPAIVDAPLWHRAQERIKERAESKAKPQPGRGGILSGFVHCGRCEYALSKSAPSRYNGQVVHYHCTSAQVRPHLGCGCWRVNEEALLPRVCKWLVESIDAEVLDALQASPAQDDGRSADEALLAEQVRVLTERVTGATESALLAPPGAREAAWGMVARMQDDLERARQQLALVQAVRNAPELGGFRAWWEEMKETILIWVSYPNGSCAAPTVEVILSGQELSTADDQPLCPVILYPADKDRLRALLTRLGFTVKVWWELNPNRRKQRDPKYLVHDVQIGAEVDLAGFFCAGSQCYEQSQKQRPEPITIRRVFSMADQPPAA